MTKRWEFQTVAKAILWEEAKGKLRAMVAAQGAYYGGYDEDEEDKVWISLEKEVNGFIKNVEDNGWHE